MATGDERHTTRARANVFREIAGREHAEDPFLSHEIKEVFDYCLSCKGCKSECPSNVDIAKIKTEFLYQNQKLKGTPFRTKLIGNFTKSNKKLEKVPWLYNMVVSTKPLAFLFKIFVGFATGRSLPKMNRQPVVKWFRENIINVNGSANEKRVLLFVDEFTNYNDFSAGVAVVNVLTKLGYKIELTDTMESGRSYISKGMLDQAKEIANHNINSISLQLSDGVKIIGIEPSAILSFRDEYLDLADDKDKARDLSTRAMLFEEFIAAEVNAGNIDKSLFKPLGKTIKYHGHCHQKALSEISALHNTLELIPASQPQKIPSGCCGMAGSFGYEKEHYEMSMQVGELVLFPAVRESGNDEMIIAPGTSCRHQIKDGTSTRAYHPAEALWMSLS